jgi:hypothetical protein
MHTNRIREGKMKLENSMESNAVLLMHRQREGMGAVVYGVTPAMVLIGAGDTHL